jgi:hypothetical protein
LSLDGDAAPAHREFVSDLDLLGAEAVATYHAAELMKNPAEILWGYRQAERLYTFELRNGYKRYEYSHGNCGWKSFDDV